MYENYMICETGFRNTAEGGKITGFQFDIRIPYYRGLYLSMLEDFGVKVDGVSYPRECIRFAYRGHIVSLDKLAGITDVQWEFGSPATLMVKKPGGLAPGTHHIQLTQRLRISYLPWPAITTGDANITLDSRTIRSGVSLYSYQQEYYLRQMNLEDCVRAVSELGADGVEILGEQMIPQFPNPSEDFVDRWYGWMEKYKTTPTTYDAFLDTKLHKDRVLTVDESVQMMARDMKLANRLGFKFIRVLVMVSREIIEKSLPYAEQYNVKLGLEVHAPFSLKSAWIDEYCEMIERTGTKHFGFIPDMGIFVRRLPPVLMDWYVRHGATKKLVHYVGEQYASGGEKEKVKAKVAADGGNEMDVKFAEMAFHYSCDDPNWLRKYIPHMLHIHAKFYEMTEECVEPSIPYDEIVPILAEEGYTGYLSSEYEGQRHIQDAFEVDSVEQVRRQHRMFERILTKCSAEPKKKVSAEAALA